MFRQQLARPWIEASWIASTTNKSAFLQRGTSEAIAQAMVGMAAGKHQGLVNAEPRTPKNSAGTSFR